MPRERSARAAVVAVALVALVTLVGCTPGSPPSSSAPVSPPAAQPRPTGTSSPVTAVPLRPAGDATVLETGLVAPWSVVPLPSGAALISERDSGLVRERLPQGGLRDVGTVPGVVHAGEGGLLGLAVPPGPAPAHLYAYETTAQDNRVVRMPLDGVPGDYTLGTSETVVSGLPKGTNHNGGRIAFGPDGMLYVTVGDAGTTSNAQDLASLGGKILRVSPDGRVPGDNPFPGSPVWSYGHRNPQGIGWDAHGTMWASEFGQNTWDELNIIRPGADYGWPVVEGIGSDPAYTDPVQQWRTSDASPSGLAVVGDTIFIAALRGERLWTVWSTAGGAPVTAEAFLDGTYGRLRDVVARGDRLWVLTNNTDGRGDPRSGDDRLLEVTLAPADPARLPG
ncbi:PQQ-dependent sugar dehydrogenase [Leifsonia aquatica]|uniref:PQQ-dependent sugar dehydrogenase n=1 Tax=Leifsonia aquatica TaxID=144185 RepID=UPI00046A94D3|nr:PQQ-dependent sugar dehydrogenase [Leifsonia aquatica]